MSILQTSFCFLILFNNCFTQYQTTSFGQKMEQNFTKTKLRYLVYECKFRCGGWADRLKGIMSVYALSLLTNSRFIIDIRTPCNFSRLFESNEIEWRAPVGLNLNRKRIYKDCLNDFEPKCIEEFLNGKLTSNKILTIKTNQEWLTWFSKNIFFQSKILNLGFNSTEHFQFHQIFHRFYKRLFKLAPALDTKYKSVLAKSKINNQTQIYCAQIRIGGSRPHVKYDLRINELGVQRLFWNFIRKNFIASSPNNDWRVFVTSDVESIELEAVKEFGQNRVIRIQGINSHVDREENLGNDCTRVEKPILDFHFLQNCDKAVISQSGFGRLGLWNRPNPMENLFAFDGKDFKKLDHDMSNTIKEKRNENIRFHNSKYKPCLFWTNAFICLVVVCLIFLIFKYLNVARKRPYKKAIALFSSTLLILIFFVF